MTQDNTPAAVPNGHPIGIEDRVAVAAMKERAARAILVEAEQEMLEAIEAARERSIPWARLKELTGLTTGQLQWRWNRDEPGNDLSLPRPRAPRRTGRGPGLSVTDAARQLGVTRRTIYLRVEAGKLRSTTNELGQTRILLES
jgi:excisionase family DNA binding protein